MATLLDVKRKEVELKKVEASRFELEIKIMEREEEIQRVKDHLKIQDQKIDDIKKEIEALKSSI